MSLPVSVLMNLLLAGQGLAGLASGGLEKTWESGGGRGGSGTERAHSQSLGLIKASETLCCHSAAVCKWMCSRF